MKDKPFTRLKAYTTAEAAELGGIAYPTLGYLNAKGILKPSVRLGGHQGAANAYSFADLVALCSISELRKGPASLGALSAVAEFWKSDEGLALADTGAEDKVLIVTPDGKAVLENDAPVLQLSARHRTDVLHVINVGGLVDRLHLWATEQHMIAPTPKRRGRPPGRMAWNAGSTLDEERPRPGQGERRAGRDAVRVETKRKGRNSK
jgi:DNA-binding transcriptional MerR regulator